TLDAVGGRRLTWGATPAGKLFQNDGTFLAEADTIEVPWTQLGEVTVAAGLPLVMSGGGTLGGTVDVDPAGTFRIQSNAVTFDGGISFPNAGRVELPTSTLTILAGDSIVLPRFAQSGGILAGGGWLTLTDSLIWSNGSQTGVGTTYIATGAVAYLTGGNTKGLDTRTFRNTGSVLHDGGSWQLSGGNPTIIVNEASGIIEVAGAVTIEWGSTPTGKLLQNDGLLHARPGTGNTITLDVPITLNGTLQADTGTTILAEPTFTLGSTATLAGTGTLNVSQVDPVTLSGDLVPGTSPGRLTLVGDLTLGAAATTTVEIDGAVAGTSHDQVLITTGSLALGGTLDVTFGFTPSGTEQYPVLVAPTISGTFGTINLPTVSGFILGTQPALDGTTDTLYVTAVGIPPGTESIWTGASDGNWFNGGNWTTGVFPDDTTNAFIPVGTGNVPTVQIGTATVDTLVVQAGAVLNLLLGGTLIVSGDLEADYTGLAGDGTGIVRMVTPGTSVSGGLPRLEVALATMGRLFLADSVLVTNDVELTRGVLTLNGHRLSAGGELAVFASGADTGSIDFGPVDGVSTTATFTYLNGSGTGFISMHDDADTLFATAGVGLFGTVPSDTALTGGVIVVGGDFDEDGSPGFLADSLGTTRVVMTGAGTTLWLANAAAVLRHLEIAQGATVQIGYSTTTIHGDVTVSGTAQLNLDQTGTVVRGDFLTTGSATITQTTGDITVQGNLIFDGESTIGLLTGGVFEAHGDFTQLASTSVSSFAADATHTVRFVSDGGTHTIDLATPGTTGLAHFAQLETQALGGGLTLDLRSVVPAHGPIVIDDNNGDFQTFVTGPGELLSDGNITFFSDGNGVTVTAGAVRLGGTLSISAGVDLSPDTLEVFGTTTLPVFTGYPTTLITGDVDLPFGNPVVGFADLIVGDGGAFDCDTCTATVGLLTTTGTGTLRQAGGTITVDSARFGGGSTDGLLFGGSLIVNGAFEQLSTNSALSFAPSTSHTTSFAGTGAHPIHFDTPDSLQSHFQALVFNGDGIEFTTSAFANGSLTHAATGIRTITGNGHRLNVRGVDIDSLVLDWLQFTVTGTGPLTEFRQIQFINMDPDLTQLYFGRATGAFQLDDVSFLTPPNAGRYLTVEDVTGAGDGTLTLTMSNPTPATHSGFAVTIGGASLLGWPES
ncbi:MAG TPA: hypothetical protein VGA37_05355, partial [Gemmatimonadales bacterium]